ncbi:MAG: FtsX-like permease family protein [Bryobacteraceae bacterium]
MPSQFNTAAFATFAGLSLLLAAVRLYGVVSQSVSQRRKEIGIRIALGATPREVIATVVREGVQLAVIGAVAGVAGGLALTRLMRGILFEVRTTDP